MRVLVITSDKLNPCDTFNSSFELSLAIGLSNRIKSVQLLSVYMMSPWDLTKAFLIKLFFSFKKNEIVHRYTSRELAGLFFGHFLSKKKYQVLHFTIRGIALHEAVCISNLSTRQILSYADQWNRAGLEAFNVLSNKIKPDILHAHSRFFYGIALANSIKHQYSIPYIITEHSSYYLRNLVPKELLSSIKRIYEEADVATAVSYALRKEVLKLTDVQIELDVIGNSLSPIYELDTPLIRQNKNPFIIVSVARLDDNKNHELLVRAFAAASIPDSKLVIVGEGETHRSLKILVNSLGIANLVHFAGLLKQEDVRRLLLQASCLVVSSRFETFSVATIEAHACGIPVISTPCGGPSDLINSDNGILLKGFTISEMAEALCCLHSNYNHINRIKIRSGVLDRFKSSKIADEYIELFSKVLKCVTN